MLKETVKQTYNYNLFKLQEWNRNINQSNLKMLDQRVKKEGWRKHPIQVDEYGKVYDGQHRLYYAKTHNLPVYYEVVKGLKKDDCVIMNTARKQWSVDDYVHFYASQNNENYVRLQELKDEFSFLTYTTILNIIALKGWGGTNQNKVRTGELAFNQEKYRQVYKRLKFCQSVEPYVSKVKGRSNLVYLAIAYCYENENIDNDKLFNAIKNRIQTIVPPSNLEWALKGLEEIYNWHSRTDYVYIENEYKRYAQTYQARMFRK